MTSTSERKLLSQCRQIKVHKICESGFLWAFEFLDGKCMSETRKRLHSVETEVQLCFQTLNKGYSSFDPGEKEFVALFVKEWKRYCRGYIFSISADRKFRVFLIDYGVFLDVQSRFLRPLPDFASPRILKPLAMKIALHGVLPVYMELSLKDKPTKKASKSWNAKCVKFIDDIVTTSHGVYFKEIVTIEKFQFGIIYLRISETGPLESLQDLLVQKDHALKHPDFDEVLPSIVKHLVRSKDNVQLPVCKEETRFPSPVYEISDNENDSEDQHLPEIESPVMVISDDSGSSSDGQRSETVYLSGNSEVNSSPERKPELRHTPPVTQSYTPDRPRGRAKLMEKILSRPIHSTPNTPNTPQTTDNCEDAVESLNNQSSKNVVPSSFSTPVSSPISESRVLKSRGRGQAVGQIGSFCRSESFDDARSDSNSPSTSRANLSPKVADFFQGFEKTTSRLRTPELNSPMLSDVKEQLKFERDLINTIMLVGDGKFQPVHFLKDLNLHPEIKERLVQLYISDLNTCQKYMIPAVTTRKNITLIDGPKCGKTLSCMISLMSLLKDEKFYKRLPIGTSPKTIVVCPYSSRCEWIYQQCTELAKRKHDSEASGERLKINVAYGCGTKLEHQKMLELTKTYDIIICTPRCLLRLLEKRTAFNFSRLCHIVFDETHILLDVFYKEVVEIMKMTIASTKQHEGLLLPQRIVISNSWLPTVKVPVNDEMTYEKGLTFFKAVIKEDIKSGLGIALLSSYLEAAVFSKVKANLKFLDSEKKKNDDILDYLNKDGAKKSVVIVFKDVEKMKETRHMLNTSRTILLVSENHAKLREDISSWKSEILIQGYPILLCTDFILPNLNLYEADCLIHYDLPETKSTFSYRFSVLLNQLKVPKEYCKSDEITKNTSKAETLIYLHRKNSDQFPIIVNLMERLNASIPTEVKNISNKLKFAKEHQKRDQRLCDNLKKFGKCSNESLCEYRHTFLYDCDGPNSNLPTDGLVKVHILHIYSANHFCVRLLEHKSGSGEWNLIKSIPHPLAVQMKIKKYFSDPVNEKIHICESVGEVAAVEVDTKTFKRVKILKFIGDEKKSAIVKFMEDGKIDTIRTAVLLALPKELAEIPAPTVDVYLCNLRPIDEDEEWGTLINNSVEQKIQFWQGEGKTIFVGKIQLVSGCSIWLHPFEGKQWFELINSYQNVFSVFKHLTTEGMAIVNENHLSELKKMYMFAGLTPPAETSVHETSISITSKITSPKSSPVSKAANESHESTSKELRVVSKANAVSNELSEKDKPAEEDEVPYITPLESTPDLRTESACQSLIQASDSIMRSHSSQSDETISSDEQESFNIDALPSDAISRLNDNDSENSFDVDFTAEELQLILNKLMPEPVSPVSESVIQTVIKPTIFWKQNLSHVIIKINVNCDDYSLQLTLNQIHFRARVDHDKVYEFNERLYASIDENQSQHYKSGVQIYVRMEKLSKRNKWARLINSREIQPWIKLSQDCVDEEDIKEQDEYWPEQLCKPPALEEVNVDIDWRNSKQVIFPDGYEDDPDYESDADSDYYGDKPYDD